MLSGVFHHAPFPRLVGPTWFRMTLLPCTSGGSGTAGLASLNVMYRQQFVDSEAGQRAAITSGSTVGAAWATPAGSTTAIVPASTARAAASPNLRTTAHPLYRSNGSAIFTCPQRRVPLRRPPGAVPILAHCRRGGRVRLSASDRTECIVEHDPN